jgi:hypothetical protein
MAYLVAEACYEYHSYHNWGKDKLGVISHCGVTLKMF